MQDGTGKISRVPLLDYGRIQSPKQSSINLKLIGSLTQMCHEVRSCIVSTTAILFLKKLQLKKTRGHKVLVQICETH
jgi:hypothetical protein